jgi:hypothetical protein
MLYDYVHGILHIKGFQRVQRRKLYAQNRLDLFISHREVGVEDLEHSSNFESSIRFCITKRAMRIISIKYYEQYPRGRQEESFPIPLPVSSSQFSSARFHSSGGFHI